MFFLLLIAQSSAAAATELGGGAGWVGAGLLGVVLWWLAFYHLPARDKQLGDMTMLMLNEIKAERQRSDDLHDKRDQHIDRLSAACHATQKTLAEDSKAFQGQMADRMEAIAAGHEEAIKANSKIMVDVEHALVDATEMLAKHGRGK
jgi:hypothetical protein